MRSKNVLKFINDAKIEQIIDIHDDVSKAKYLAKKSKSDNGIDSSVPRFVEFAELPMDNKEVIIKPTVLVESSCGESAGSDMFNFSNTPKKPGQMLEKAMNSPRTPRTPRRFSRVAPGTPKTPKASVLKYYNNNNNIPRTPTTPKTPRSQYIKALDGTPKSSKKGSDLERLKGSTQEAPSTPYSFRRTVRQKITKIVYFNDGSSSEDIDDSDNDSNFTVSSDDDVNDESLPINKRFDHVKAAMERTPRKTPSKMSHGHSRKRKDAEMLGDTNDYFMHHDDNGKVITSDHTLGNLDTPRLTPSALKLLLSGTKDIHSKERMELMDDHSALFPIWMTLLCEGFSIFLNGVGSKKELLSQFQEDYLKDLDHIVINGFFPSLTLKSILNCITQEILSDSSKKVSQDQLEFICNYYNGTNCDPLYLIIHNLDGTMLRSSNVQTVLSQIAALPSVHIVATFDHINAPLLMDGNTVSTYNPLWWDITTLSPYTEETSYENSLLVQQSGALALSSLIHVFRSLTPNAKGIFLLLARYQLERRDDGHYSGMSFSEMYQRCREAFLVNSDLTLRAQLTEFRDHKLIKSKKGNDGVENLLIPLEAATLNEFVLQPEQDGL